MGNIIENFITQNEKISSFLDDVVRDRKNADANIQEVKHFVHSNNYNAALGIELACLLQLLDQPQNFSDFELNDIKRLFASLIKLNAYDLDAYVEAGNFEWAIMDNKVEALAIVDQGISRASEKLEQLRALKKTIESDSEN